MRFVVAIWVLLSCSWAYAGEPDRAVLVQIDEKLDQQQLDQATLKSLVSQLEGMTGQYADSVSVWLRLGLVQARMGKYELAFNSVANGLGVKADDPHLLALRGMVRWRQGKPIEAGRDFEAVLKVKPKHPVANVFKAYRAIMGQDYKAAIVFARSALVGNPRDLNAYSLMAFAHYKMGNLDMARLISKSSMEIADTNADIFNVLGIIATANDRLGSAGNHYRKATTLDDEHIAAQLNLGSFALSVNDFENALRHFDAVQSVDPNHVWMLLSRGVALRGLGRLDEAASIYQRVIELQPDNLEARYNLCILKQEHSNDVEAGLRWCREMQSMVGPKHPKARELRNRIEGMKLKIEMAKEPAPTPEDKPDDNEEDGDASETPE